MDTWVKDVIGLTLAADSAIFILGVIVYSFYTHMFPKPEYERDYVYKNYNYTITTDKDPIVTETTNG